MPGSTARGSSETLAGSLVDDEDTNLTEVGGSRKR
jgi:hypothetical protein